MTLKLLITETYDYHIEVDATEYVERTQRKLRYISGHDSIEDILREDAMEWYFDRDPKYTDISWDYL